MDAPDAARPRVRAADRGDRVHGPRGGGEPRRRGQRQPQAAQAAGRSRARRSSSSIYVGISLVGVGALPVHDGVTALGTDHINAPVLGVVEALQSDMARRRTQVRGRDRRRARAAPRPRARRCSGVSRVGYSLATNRQIPSAVGRLHPRWGTPFVIIGAGGRRRGRARAARRPRAAGRDLSRSGRCWRSRSRTCR